MGGSRLDWTDDFQKFCRAGLERIQLLQIRIGLGLKISQSAHLCREGSGSGELESTPDGFCVFLSARIRSQNFVKKRTRIRSHFSISAVAGVCVVIS